MRVLALDPGKLTGLAEYDDYRDSHEALALEYQEALERVDRSTRYGYVNLVVCEDFVISPRTLKTGTDGWRRGAELEFIGAVRWMCHKGDVELVLQTPADAKGFSTDEKLRAIGWWTRGKDHPRDASRHLMLALVNRRLIDPSRLLVGSD